MITMRYVTTSGAPSIKQIAVLSAGEHFVSLSKGCSKTGRPLRVAAQSKEGSYHRTVESALKAFLVAHREKEAKIIEELEAEKAYLTELLKNSLPAVVK